MFAANSSQKADDKLYVDDVFSTYLYTGNGTTQTINNGIDLAGKGGMVWVKSRNSTTIYENDHYTHSGDLPFGWESYLKTNQTDSRSGTFNSVVPTSTGFTVQFDNWNKGGGAYSSWTFRKAPKFFDVVTWTGDGVSGRQIPHSLGLIPGVVITKATSTADIWNVRFTALGSKTILQLQSTAADLGASNGVTAISSTTFTVGTASEVNANGVSYVAYLFAHDLNPDGFVQCGSFITDASGNATVNTIGWEPQFAMIKAKSTTGDWIMLDTMRGWNLMANGDGKLAANSADAETYGEYGNPTATGFEFKGGVANATYVYMVIRRSNKPPTSGTQVFYSSYSTGQIITNNIVDDMNMICARGGSSRNFAVADRLRGIPNQINSSTYWYFTQPEKSTPELITSSTVAETNAKSFFYFSGQPGAGSLLLDNRKALAYVTSWSNTGGASMYSFKRAPGFFDVVCYTGNGGSNGSITSQAIHHNLGVPPELLVVKSLKDIGGYDGHWITFAPFAGFTAGVNWYSKLYQDFSPNQGQGATYLNNYPPTIDDFTVRYAINLSDKPYIAYLFASCPGVSKVGRFIGNGTTQTINCGFTTGARFVLVKRAIDVPGDWYVWDTARGIVADNDPHLSLNTTAAEVATDDSVDPALTGFIVNQNTATNINVSGHEYIYLAIA